MNWYFKMLAVVAIMFGLGYSVNTYTQGQKAQKAMELGYQECSEVDNLGNTIILMKKECKGK